MSKRKKRMFQFKTLIKNHIPTLARSCAVVIVFAVLGFFVLRGTHAATYATAREAESGTVSGNASIVSDASASGGSAVKFGTKTSGGGGGGGGTGGGNGGIAVPSAPAGVPVPVSGSYWGSTNVQNDSNIPGCSNKGVALLECKITWAAAQQHLSLPLSGNDYHFSMIHDYIKCDTGDGAFKPGGDVYDDAHTPGRKAIMLNIKCGNWSTLANGAGKSATDQQIKHLTDMIVGMNVPVLWTFDAEPEDNSCEAAKGYTGTSDEYRAAFRQWTADVRNEEAHLGKYTISTGWNLMGETYRVNGHALFSGNCNGVTRGGPVIRNPENWYPGDDAIDWIVVDKYSSSASILYGNAMQDFTDWANAACPATGHPTVNWNCSTARQRKPLGVGEFGVNTNSASARADWFDNMNNTVTKFPRMKALLYWSGSSNYFVDGPVEAQHQPLKAFSRLTANPYLSKPTF